MKNLYVKIYKHKIYVPNILIIILFITTSVWHELDRSTLFILPELTIGNIRLRYFDPIVFFISCITVFGMFILNKKNKIFYFKSYITWTLLFAWLVISVILSMYKHGSVNALGEFRTYYYYILLIPFIVIYYNNEVKQWSLFKLLIMLSLLLLISTFVRAIFEYDLRIDSLTADNRWLRSRANLTLLYALISVYLSHKYQLINISKKTLIIFGIIFLMITIINSHRTVWAILCVSFLVLIISKEIDIKQLLYISSIALIGAIITMITYSKLGLDFLSFIQDRGQAFTDFEGDGTTRWRYMLWLQAINGIYNNPIFGVGLGKHFQMIDPAGNIVTTSVHNYYLTAGYHIGLIGLLLYLIMVIKIYIDFNKVIKKIKNSKRTYVMILTSIIALISSHIYYMTWDHDTVSWLYVSLGISIVITFKQRFYNK